MKRNPHRRPARAAVVVTRWIIPVDETPIRDAVIREHLQLEEQAAAVREKIERFESADLPAYTRWEARVLGPLLTAVREAETAIRQKRDLLEAIEDEVFFSGCSPLAAYRRVMRAREAHEEFDDEQEDPFPPPGEASRDEEPEDSASANGFGLPPGFDADDFDLLTPAQQRAFRMEYNYMAEMYEAMTGQVAPDIDDLLRASRRGKREKAQGKSAGSSGSSSSGSRAHAREPEPDRPSSRIKELYRLLVRKLHPDLNPEQSARDRELWHTVQEAYNRRDVDALEAAAARVEIGLNGQSGHLPISILRRLVLDLRKALGALKSRFATVRKNPAFDFASRSTGSLAKFEEKHRKQLERNLRGLQTYLGELTASLDDLAARAAKPRKKRKQRVDLYQ